MLSLQRSAIYVAALLLTVGIQSSLLAAEDLPAPGTVFLRDGPAQSDVFIIREGFTETAWSRDDRMQVRTSRPSAEIERVEYTPIPRSERGYIRGIGAFSARNWANSVDGFADAAANSRYAYYRIDAHLKRATALMRLRRYDEALVDVRTVVSKYKDWIYVIDAMELEGQIHLAAGKQGEAIKAYQALRQAAAGFGGKYAAVATSRGALGEARALIGDNKHAAAVPLLRQALAAVPMNLAPLEHGQVAITLGDALLATGAKADAAALFTTLRYAPVAPEHRAKSFLEVGKLSQDSGDTIAAVDALITAAVMRGASDEVRAEARRRARALLTTLGTDASLSPELQREYRAYGSNL